MYESGVYKHMHTKIMPEILHCPSKKLFHSADLPGLSTAFFILLIGYFVSMFLFICEILIKKYYNRNNKKKRFQFEL